MPISDNDNALTLTWREGVAADYADILPRSWFASDTDGVDAVCSLRRADTASTLPTYRLTGGRVCCGNVAKRPNRRRLTGPVPSFR